MKRITMFVLVPGLFLLAAATLPKMRTLAQEDLGVTSANLSEKVKNAKTTSDHELIAEYYDKEAADNTKLAELHLTMRNVYFKPPMPAHCYYLAKAYQQAADQDKALAAAQRQMAKGAGGQTGQ